MGKNNCVQKTMLILRILADAKGKSVTLSDISELTGINKSTASHIIKDLCCMGYVTRVSHREGYTTGPELFFLTRYGRFGGEYVSICHPLLEWLCKKTGGTAILAVVEGGKKYIIDYVEGDLHYKDSGAFIMGDDLYRTVTGRVILANIPTHEALEIFNENGVPPKGHWNEVCDRESFLHELSLIRKDSVFGMINENEGRVLCSFASALFSGAKCLGALGLVVAREEKTLDGGELAGINELVSRARKEFQRRLEFS